MEHAAENDVRTQRTKAAIRKTLKEMIVEMDCRQITVSELTKRAGIHRKTFYLHYETIDDLFYELADEIAAGMREVIDGAMESGSNFDIGYCMKVYSRFLSENDRLHRQLFCNESYSLVYQRVQTRSCEYFNKRILADKGGDPELLWCISLFMTYGLNAIWRNYYMTGMPSDPAKLIRLSEALANIISAPIGA